MEKLRTKLDAAERRLQEADEIVRAKIAECEQKRETVEKVSKYAESIVETIREPLIVLTRSPGTSGSSKVSLNGP
jgi:hypothetical protein